MTQRCFFEWYHDIFKSLVSGEQQKYGNKNGASRKTEERSPQGIYLKSEIRTWNFICTRNCPLKWLEFPMQHHAFQHRKCCVARLYETQQAALNLINFIFLFPGYGGICAMVKSRYIGDGHPTFNRNPYNWYIKPYYWVDEFIPYYMEIMGVDRPDRTYVVCFFLESRQRQSKTKKEFSLERS